MPIPKPRAVNGLLRPLKKSLDPVVEVLNKGLVLDTEHVIAERMPDDRIRLKLHPDIARKLGLPVL